MGSFHLEISKQPNDETCGPTCLHAIYQYYGEFIELDKLIAEVQTLETGGTLAVLLGCHALSKDYKATIYTYNLQIFDPTWFAPGVDMIAKLKLQMEYKKDPKLQFASKNYIRFLEKGGKIKLEELNHNLIRKYLVRHIPLLTGLNAAYLYRCSREINNEFDDIKGFPMGHFVVVSGYNKEDQKVLISDPLLPNPVSKTHQYLVNIDRLINSIMLGILTYDANLLVIEKAEKPV